MRYWCICTSLENWEICKKHKVWGMDARYFVTMEKFLKPGDKAVVYISKEQKFVAIVEFIGRYFFDATNIGWKKGEREYLFPYRIKFKIIYESKNPPKISYSTKIDDKSGRALWENKNLIDDITFIADKSETWNQYFQVSIIRLTEEDFNVISEAIREGC